MNSLILSAMGAGLCAGAVILFLSHIAPHFGAGNFVRDLDQPVLFGKHITKREAHFVGILVYLVLSLLFGGLFGFLVSLGILQIHFLSIIGWSVILALIYGGIVLPLEGHGLFGVKEDPWFPVDLFLSYLLWAVIFWWLMRLWLSFAV